MAAPKPVPAPVKRDEETEVDKPKIKSRYFTNNGGERPRIEVDGPAEDHQRPIKEVAVPRATPTPESPEPKRPSLASRDIEELLNDLEGLDILDDEDD